MNKHIHPDELVTTVEDQGLLPTAPLVSVVITAYNHEDFIVQAIESALEQKTDFDYEIIVAEDKSTDSTSDIVLDFQRCYPEKVRLRLAQKNLYSQGIKPWAVTFPACRGKYIAMLDGDDYWTDSLKLQKQIAYLEDHPEAAGCFTDCCIADTEDFEVKSRSAWERGYVASYDQRACLTTLGSCYGTATLVFRRSVLIGGLADTFTNQICDFFLDLVITENGTLDYLPGKTAVYRIHSGGSWQRHSVSDNRRMHLLRISLLGKSPVIFGRYPSEISKLWTQFLRDYEYNLSLEYSNPLDCVTRVIDFCIAAHADPFRAVSDDFCLRQLGKGWRSLGSSGKNAIQRLRWLVSIAFSSPRLLCMCILFLTIQVKSSVRVRVASNSDQN